MENNSSPVKDFYSRLEIQKREAREALIKQQAQSGAKRGRPRKSKMYFTITTEEAIVAYNLEKSQPLKEKVYQEHIHYPLFKMAENIINRFRFYYMDGNATDVKYEVIAFLLEKLPKYTQDKGKAFSYFSIVAKNYLIQNNNKAYRKLINRTNINGIDIRRDIPGEMNKETRQQGVRDFMDRFIIHYESLISEKFRGDRDKRIAYAVLELFKTRDNIENYNKKALYIMIREMTGTKTQYITKVVNEIKTEYVKLFRLYEKDRLTL